MARILVVDDDPNMVEMLCSMLELNNHQTERCGDGNAALVRLGVESGGANIPLPDLVILDHVMPGLDGFTVASRLSKHEATRRLPILIMTGRGEQMRHFFKDLPSVKGFLEKPFDLDELVALIASATGGENASG